MKKISKFLVKNRKRFLSVLMIFVTFISFYSTELIVCAEEISDAYKHWKNEASYTNAFDYALFSGSETDSFVTNANSFKVVGDIHTNSSFVYRGNTIEVAGDIESSDYNTISVSDKDYKKKIGKIKDYSSYVIIPNITEDIKDEIREDAKVYAGYTGFNNTIINKNAIVNGEVGIYAREVLGDSVIVASGNIQMGLDSLKTMENGSLFLCSEKGNIQINSSNTTMNGILYAPNGYVMITGENFKLNGRIIAKKIMFYGSNIEVIKGENDLDILDCLSDEVPDLIVSSDDEGVANHIVEVSLLDNKWLEKVDDNKIEIKVLSSGEELTEGEDYYILSGSDKLEKRMVFKNPGLYEIQVNAKYKLKNISGSKEIGILEDEGIEPVVLTNDYYLRNENGIADISVVDLSYSLDGDEIGNKTIKVNYDSNNDGTYETEVNNDTFDLSEYTFNTDKVGKYSVTVSMAERLLDEVSEVYQTEFVNCTDTTVYFEVGNEAPSIEKSIKLSEKPQILVLYDNDEDSSFIRSEIERTKDNLSALGYKSESKLVKLSLEGDDKNAVEIGNALSSYNFSLDSIYIINLCDFSHSLSKKGEFNAEKLLIESGAKIVNVSSVSAGEITNIIIGNQKIRENVNAFIVGQEVEYFGEYKDLENDPCYKVVYEYVITNEDGEQTLTKEEPVTVFDIAGTYDITVKVQDNPVGDNDSLDEYRKWSKEYEIAKELTVTSKRPDGDIKCNTFESPVDDSKYMANIFSDDGRDVEYIYKKDGDDEWIEGKLPDNIPMEDKYLVIAETVDENGIKSLPKFLLVEYTDLHEEMEVTGEIVKINTSSVGLLVSDGTTDTSLVEEGLNNKTVFNKDIVFAKNIYDFGGHFYMVSNDKIQWADAKEKCEELGGHLVVMSSAEENSFVKGILDKEGKSYYTAIGYSDEEEEGKWVTVNGEEVTFTGWNGGEPNNGLWMGEQDHAYMNENGTWDDGWYDNAQYYVCEWEDEEGFRKGVQSVVGNLVNKSSNIKYIVTDLFEDASFNSDEIKAIWEEEIIETGAEIVSISGFTSDAIDLSLNDENELIMAGDKTDLVLNGLTEDDETEIEISFTSFDGQNSFVKTIDTWEDLTESGVYKVSVNVINKEELREESFVINDKLSVYERPEIKFFYTKEPLRTTDNEEVCTLEVNYSVKSVNKADGSEVEILNTDVEWKEINDIEWTKGIIPNELPVDKVFLVKGVVTDGLGIKSLPEVFIVSTRRLEIVDKTGPEITLDLSKDVIVLGESVNISFDAADISGVDSMELFVNGEVVLESSGTYTYTPANKGEEIIIARAKDTKGNESSQSRVLRVREEIVEDENAPTVTIESISSRPDDGNILDIYGSVYDDTELLDYVLVYRLEGDTYEKTISNGSTPKHNELLGSILLSDLEAGLYTIELRATDISGNKNSASATINTGVMSIEVTGVTLSEDGERIDVFGYIVKVNEIASVTYVLKDENEEEFPVNYENVEEGTLCTIDTESMHSGEYTLVIEATDTEGYVVNVVVTLDYTKGEKGEDEFEIIDSFVPFEWQKVEIDSENNILRITGKPGNQEYFYELLNESGEAVEYSVEETEEGISLVVSCENLESNVYTAKAIVSDKNDLVSSITFKYTVSSEETQEEIVIEQNDNLKPVIYDVLLNESKTSLLVTGDSGLGDLEGEYSLKCVNKETGDEVIVDEPTDETVENLIGIIPVERLVSGYYELYLSVSCVDGRNATTYTGFLFTEGQSGGSSLDIDDGEEYDTTDTIPPTADIYINTDNLYIEKSSDVFATAKDDKGVKRYLVEYRLKGTEDYYTLAKGEGAIEDAKVSEFDPSNVINGVYEFRITVTDVGGNTVSGTKEYTVNNQLKIGAMSIGFTDLSRKLYGMSVNVNRKYNNRNKYVGDFGYGWNSDITGMTMSLSNDLTYGYVQDTVGTGLGTQFQIRETACHDVILNMGDGTTKTFKLALSPSSQAITPISSTSVKFKCAEDPYLKLEIVSGDSAEFIDNYLLWDNDANNSFIEFKLTDRDDNKYYFDNEGKVCKIESKNGETLFVSKNGIVSSDGTGISFVRDEEGRIVSASDGLGRTVYYSYDNAGDLVEFKNYDNTKVFYEYDKNHNLTAIKDSEGRIVARDEFDENGKLIASIDAEGNRIVYEYDPDLMMQKITDRRGNSSVYYYDSYGFIVKTIDAYGNSSSNEYDNNHNLIRKIDENGKETTYQHDEKGNVTKITYPGGVSVSNHYLENGLLDSASSMDLLLFALSYDSKGYVSKVTDANGNENYFSNDANGNVLSASDSIGTIYQATYNELGKPVTFIDSNRNNIYYNYNENGDCVSATITGDIVRTVSFSYDSWGNISSSKDSLGNITQYSYDCRGNLLSSTDACGNIISYQYDLLNNVTKIVYPDGSEETYDYDIEGNVIETKSRNGLIKKYEYDKLNRLTKVLYPNGTYEIYSYDAVGNVISATSTNGVVSEYEYDSLYRNIKISNPIYGETKYIYDEFSMLSSVTDAYGNTKEYKYDHNGNLIKEILPDGTIKEYVYDARNRLTKSIDGYGYQTVYSYDNSDRLTTVKDPDGNQTSYSYDFLGNLVCVTDGNNHSTKYLYDSESRLISMTNAVGKNVRYDYDSCGRIVKCTDYSGKETEYIYDSCGNVLVESSSENTINCSYYNQRISSVNDSTGMIKYYYDSLGQLTGKIDSFGNDMTFSYDSYGNIKKIECLGVKEEYSYDSYGRLVSVNNQNDEGATYNYDNLSRVIEVAYSNGIITSYTYDACGRVNETITSGKDGSILSSYEYTYGKNGEILTSLESYSLDGENIRTEIKYSYSRAGMLLSETYSEGSNQLVQSYEYDCAGNRIKKKVSVKGDVSKIVKEELVFGTTLYTYNEINQLVEESTDSASGNKTNQYTYDDNGNLIRVSGSKEAEYTYNSNNQLIEAKVKDNGLLQTEQYGYDANGNRISKKNQKEDIRYIIYDVNGLSFVFAETDENGDLRSSYLRGYGLVNETLYSEKSHTYYFNLDGNGDVRNLSDENGNITDTYSFDAFGINLIKEGDTANDYGYRSEQTDSITGLVYLRARYMNPSTGTFITEDSFGGFTSNPITLNRYVYAGQNPISYRDPSGHFFGAYGEVLSLTLREMANDYYSTIASGRIGACLGGLEAVLTGDDVGLGMAKGFIMGVGFAGLGKLKELGIGIVAAKQLYMIIVFLNTAYCCKKSLECLEDRDYLDAVIYGGFGIMGMYDFCLEYKALQQLMNPFDSSYENIIRILTRQGGGGDERKRLALGLSDYLDEFASSNGATTYKDFENPMNWKEEVLKAINDPNTDILVNLDGIDSPYLSIQRAASNTGGATDWELLQIRNTPEAWSKIQWFKDGITVPNPFE